MRVEEMTKHHEARLDLSQESFLADRSLTKEMHIQITTIALDIIRNSALNLI